MKTCKECGKPLTGRQTKFCSNLCNRMNIAKSGKTGGWNREPKVDLTCKFCKKHFFVQPSAVRQNRAIYCSRKCQHIGVMLKHGTLDFSSITETEKGYIAGFIDADGHISKPTSQICVQITNTNKAVIDWFAKKIPASIQHSRFPKENWNDQYDWRMRNASCCYQFLVAKRPRRLRIFRQ